jgi:hypothetical protein
MDLVGRKLGRKGGAAPLALFNAINGFIEENKDADALAFCITPLREGLEALQGATLWLAQHGMANPNDAGAAAVDYLRLVGIVVVGWMWARIAKSAQTKLAANPSNASFYKEKLISAGYWMERMMPECAMLRARVEAGSANIMAFEAAE